MAKQPVNKSALVREYLEKYPQKMPSALAKQITQERRVTITGKYVATIKTKLKHAGRPTAGTATAKTTPVQLKPAPASIAGLSQHIANLKAAAQKLGKDEAKQIID